VSTGLFVALEGGEGAGKSTQVDLLQRWLTGLGREVVVTREPGGTPLGLRLRELLLDPSTGALAARTEALLYAADRAEHVHDVIRPALQAGAVVLTDRYIDSSIAYQGAGRSLDPADIAKLSRWATEDLLPDLTVVLDIDPQVGLRRFDAPLDRLEAEPLSFHVAVRNGFLALAEQHAARYLVVDATQDPDLIQAHIRERLSGLVS
jgi:dTMP kinase